MPCDDPVLALYGQLTRINGEVVAALDEDAPGPALMALLDQHRAVMADLEKAETDHPPSAETVSARLDAARQLQAGMNGIQERLDQKRRALVQDRKKILHTRQALDAYERKK